MAAVGIIRNPIERPGFRFFINAADVFADDAHSDQIDRSEKGDQYRQRCPAGNGISYEIRIENMKNKENADDAGYHTGIKSDSERDGGIGENAVHREVEHFVHGKF